MLGCHAFHKDGNHDSSVTFTHPTLLSPLQTWKWSPGNRMQALARWGHFDFRCLAAIWVGKRPFLPMFFLTTRSLLVVSMLSALVDISYPKTKRFVKDLIYVTVSWRFRRSFTLERKNAQRNSPTADIRPKPVLQTLNRSWIYAKYSPNNKS